MIENEISGQIIDASYKIHTTLGPGLLESVYETALAHELGQRDLHYKQQMPITIYYESLVINNAFRADFLVEDKVIIELKSVEAVSPMHKKQLLTYLRLTNRRLGLLINFNSELLKNGVSRVVNGL